MKKHILPLFVIPVLAVSLIITTPVRAEKDLFLEAGFLQARNIVEALDFTLEDLNGRKVSLNDHRGKVIMLYFWSTW